MESENSRKSLNLSGLILENKYKLGDYLFVFIFNV